MTRKGQILSKLSFGTSPSCYLNEADPNEKNWQEIFFGSKTIYAKLKSIKNKFDPNGLFVL